jgi:hypothetical protein
MSVTAPNLECLLYFNGADGATGFTDSSVNGLTINNNDTACASLTTATKKFGTASASLTLGASHTAEAHIWGATTRNTTTTRIYGVALTTGTQIYNATRNAYSYVTGTGTDTISSPAPGSNKVYTTISPAITSQTTGDSIYYGGSDIQIPNTGSVIDLNNMFAVAMWLQRNAVCGTLFDCRADINSDGYWATLESNNTVKIKWGAGEGTTLITSTGTISNSAFTYLSLCQYGDNLALYIDTARQTIYTGTLYHPAISNIQLGNQCGGLGAGFDGYIDEVQIWSGIPYNIASFPSSITLSSSEYVDAFNAKVASVNLQTEITGAQVKVSSLNVSPELNIPKVKIPSLNVAPEVCIPNVLIASLNLQVEFIEGVDPPSTGRVKKYSGGAWGVHLVKKYSGGSWVEHADKFYNGAWQ